MKTVGIIGAGAAGLCSVRHVLATEGCTPVVWEQSRNLGGTWRLSQHVGTDPDGFPVHSSMYNNLRTDIPKVLMAFPDFPFPEGEESFVHHSEVLQYLHRYAQHYQLLPWIKFGHRVEKVAPVEEGAGHTAWEVTVRDVATGASTTTTCHYLMVCNGHFSEPSVPAVEGLQQFEGRVLHSHDYREPSAFADETVFVFGAATSGLDIALELTSTAKQVFLSHNYPLRIPSEFPANLRQVAGLVGVAQRRILLADGSSVSADAIIFCTGYKYSFPFLSEECGIQVKGGRVSPLLHQLLNVRHPSMALVGLPSRIVVFRVVDYQVRYFLATVTGRMTLPSAATMATINAKTDEERRKHGLQDKHYHRLENRQWEYMAMLAREAHLEPPPPFLQKLLGIILLRLFLTFPIFKTYDYSVSGEGEIVESRHGQPINTTWDLTALLARQLLRLLWRDFFGVIRFLRSVAMKKIKQFIGWT